MLDVFTCEQFEDGEEHLVGYFCPVVTFRSCKLNKSYGDIPTKWMPLKIEKIGVDRSWVWAWLARENLGSRTVRLPSDLELQSLDTL